MTEGYTGIGTAPSCYYHVVVDGDDVLKITKDRDGGYWLQSPDMAIRIGPVVLAAFQHMGAVIAKLMEPVKMKSSKGVGTTHPDDRETFRIDASEPDALQVVSDQLAMTRESDGMTIIRICDKHEDVPHIERCLFCRLEALEAKHE